MRILFDQGTPAPLRKLLSGHTVDLSYDLGWAALKNGERIKAAEKAGYDVLLTTDTNVRHQQNLSKLGLAIVVLPTTSWPKLKARERQIIKALESAKAGEVLQITFS